MGEVAMADRFHLKLGLVFFFTLTILVFLKLKVGPWGEGASVAANPPKTQEKAGLARTTAWGQNLATGKMTWQERHRLRDWRHIKPQEERSQIGVFPSLLI